MRRKGIKLRRFVVGIEDRASRVRYQGGRATMTGPEASLVERLCAAPSPCNMHDWEGRNGYYVATCRVSADDVPLLIDIVGRWGDGDWPNVDPEAAALLPVTAWRALADLKAGAAVQPLVDLLRALDAFDDWASEELPHVFGKIGESAIDPLMHLAGDARAKQFARSIAVCGLRRVADYHPETRDRVVARLAEMLAGADEDHVEFNTTLLVELVELQAVEAAEPIERAFAGNLIDVGMMGDWEDVRRTLGVEGLGLKMPDNPHDSIGRLRAQLGMGIFSERPLFRDGEIDADAERAYYERASATFSKSSEAQQVIDRYGDLGWFRMLLDFGLHYRYEIVDQMTVESVEEFVFEHVPRKVSTDSDSAASIVSELAMFWQYLERVYKLPQASSIVEWLGTGGLVARLEAALSDPSHFGMAKSLVMMGKRRGYDMTSETGLASFLAAYNRRVSASDTQASAAPVTREHRVGRNDLCPCGSGKKFKKCCR
jgi:hypothetical protein